MRLTKKAFYEAKNNISDAIISIFAQKDVLFSVFGNIEQYFDRLKNSKL